MKRRTRFIIIAVLLVLPVLAFAQGLVPCSGNSGDECQFCSLADLITNVIDWLILILTIITGIVFVVAGLRLVTSTGNVAEKEAAKRLITNTFIGFVIVLACWIAVDTIMKVLLSGGAGEVEIGLAPGPWNSIQCVTQPQAREATISFGAVNGGTIAESCPIVFTGPPPVFDCSAEQAACIAGGGTATVDTSNPTSYNVSCAYPAGAYTGSCDPITSPSSPCYESNSDMIAAFGSRVAEAAIICNKESGGAPIRSGSDLCCGPSGNCSGAPSFSGGYFQINILSEADKLPGCTPGAFFNRNGGSIQGDCVRRNGSGICTGWSCEITDTAMYNTCMGAALNSATNFAAAGQLFSTRGFQPWLNSANICGIPY